MIKEYCGKLLSLGTAGASVCVTMQKQDDIVQALAGAAIIGVTTGGISRVIGVDASLRKTATDISYMALGCLAIALAKEGMNDKALLFLGELVAVGTSAHTTLLKTPY